ncbi:AraC family transcriptional regulator [Chryseobacterium sp. JJR-5R]|uniref:helix-turn-helix domain-containing protein n=1 Tax=Chryseobacterium sp. JJR-5R TaxID=3093923 RepID=UPI002A755D87|nr:AraC family transcriptional regulator [Chryseobacterium sp. JJR-5R]WPO84170.1 AraC family transcriptional regulator [Chryseobacterium sp. JJR-5R]
MKIGAVTSFVYTLFIVKKGRMTFSLDHKVYNLHYLNVLQILPNSLFELKSFSQDCEVVALSATMEFCDGLDLKWGSYDSLLALFHSYSKVLTLPGDLLNGLLSNIEQIGKLVSQNEERVFTDQILRSYFSIIIYELSNIRWKPECNNQIGNRKDELALRFVNLVEKNYRNRKDVQFYADKLSVSRTHLTRTLKEVFFKSPKKIIEDKIITEAKLLLTKSDHNIQSVFDRLSFDTHAEFTRFFKNSTGFSPSQYRSTVSFC